MHDERGSACSGRSCIFPGAAAQIFYDWILGKSVKKNTLHPGIVVQPKDGLLQWMAGWCKGVVDTVQLTRYRVTTRSIVPHIVPTRPDSKDFQ